MEREHITRHADDSESWMCLCGNTPQEEGFYACDATGGSIETVTGKELHCCDNCGRIMDPVTLEIVGRRA